jgi:hypothetical protein
MVHFVLTAFTEKWSRIDLQIPHSQDTLPVVTYEETGFGGKILYLVVVKIEN